VGEFTQRQFETHVLYNLTVRQQLHKTLRTGRGRDYDSRRDLGLGMHKLWENGNDGGAAYSSQGQIDTRLLLQVHNEEHPQTSHRERKLIIRGRGME